jgi:hypothetical protein
VYIGSSDIGPEASLAFWLKLDETTGATATDASGSGNNASLSGGTTWLPAGGMRQGALAFDGISGLATITDANTLDNTSAFTLAYWFRADAYPADSAGLVCKRDGISTQNAYTTYLKTADKHIYVDLDGANDRFSSMALINTGAWYHVTLLFDGSLPATQRAQLWINGNLDITATESSSAIPNYTSNVRIGNTHAGAANWFNGRIDDVRFFRRVLSSSEIALLAATNFAPSIFLSAAPLVTNKVPALLNALVTDDGRAGPVTSQWTKISGPGGAVFTTNNPASVTLEHAGDYLLRLTARDQQAELCADLPVVVSPNTNVYEDWIALAFPAATNDAIIDMFADPEADGVQNLMEFALGMNPSVLDAVHAGPGTPGLPHGFLLNLNGTNFLAISVRRPIGRLAIAYGSEVSSNMLQWTSGLPFGAAVPNGDGTEQVIFTDTIPSTASPIRVMRLKVRSL